MVNQCQIATIVTAISISRTGIPVSAEVRYLRSPLAATRRSHACSGEPLTFTCLVHGQFIQWTFNFGYRTTFFHDQNVNTVQTVSGGHGIRAILTGNDALPGNQLARSLRSALIIDSPLSGYSHNISCSSDTSAQANLLKIAEIPSVPPNVRVSQFPLSGGTLQNSITPNTYLLTWENPENMERFDLEYFQIGVFMSELSETGTQYSVNATTTELDYHLIFPLPSIEYIMITAISKCSRELSVPAIWTNSKSHQVTSNSPSDAGQNQADQAPTTFNTINGSEMDMPGKGFLNCLLACVLTTYIIIIFS